MNQPCVEGPFFYFAKPMKLMFFTVALSLLCGVTSMAQSTFQVDAKASKMVWTGRKLTGQHQGNVKVAMGAVSWGQEGLAGAEVTMDMTSISVVDMDPEYSPRLENHLKSEDFFNTEKFPAATFKTTRVELIAGAEAGKPNYNVTGELTIKGITKPVTFPVLAWKDKKGVRAAGTMVFDRTLFDIKFRSGQFFDALGDKMIEDMVDLTFDLQAR